PGTTLVLPEPDVRQQREQGGRDGDDDPGLDALEAERHGRRPPAVLRHRLEGPVETTDGGERLQRRHGQTRDRDGPPEPHPRIYVVAHDARRFNFSAL